MQHICHGHLLRVAFLKQSLFSMLFLAVTSVYGQLDYPFHHYQYYQNPSLYNPSFAGLSAPLELNGGNCSYVSYLKAQYNYFNGNIRFFYKKNNPRPGNALGFRITGFKEGKYISGSRIYIVYAYHTKISNKVGFSGGIDMGFINYSLKGTPSTGQFAESKFDSNVGIVFYGEKFNVGISGNQLMNNEFQPLLEVLKLKRYFILTASKRFILHENFQVTTTSRVCTPYYQRALTDFSMKILFYKCYNVLLNYRVNETLSVGVGMQKVKFGNNYINLGISYNAPFMSQYINVSTIEISLNLLRYKKQKNEGYLFSL